MVDALAYLRVGHVFVANMTGNVVYLGIAARRRRRARCWRSSPELPGLG